MAKKNEKKVISIPSINVKMLSVTVQNIKGSTLITSRFPEEAIKQILEKQMGKARSGQRKIKVPEAMYNSSMYPLKEKKNACGFPAIGFKLSCVNACRYIDDLPMTVMKGAIGIFGNFTVEGDHRDFIEIIGVPYMRRDVTKNPNTKGADITFRAEFPVWSAILTVRFGSILSQEQIIDLINLAGFHVGIGAWRPSCNGDHGLFQVKSVAPIT